MTETQYYGPYKLIINWNKFIGHPASKRSEVVNLTKLEAKELSGIYSNAQGVTDVLIVRENALA